MELLLSANIGKLRRAHGMTQEQLAEALGVTFASVSKWERGAATPDLRFLTEMADLFGVSLDAIVGFEVRDGSAAALKERIEVLQRGKKYEEGIAEAEKALLRYPNMFLIVFSAGGLYTAAGIEQKKRNLPAPQHRAAGALRFAAAAKHGSRNRRGCDPEGDCPVLSFAWSAETGD